MKKGLLFILSLTLTGSLLAGCGGSSDYTKSEYAQPVAVESADDSFGGYASDDLYMYDTEAAVEESVAGNYAESPAESNSEIDRQNRKIIKNVNINAETEEFDVLIDKIYKKIEALGGYPETADVYGRSLNAGKDSYRQASITARIPSANLDAFVTSVSENSNITYKSESAEDVTLSYADTEAKISSLRTEQQRLNELIATATDVDTLIILEQRLAEVRYEIESYESRLRTMDNRIDYSTVYLNISEVEKYTPDPVVEKTVGERISEGISETFEDIKEGSTNLFVNFVIALPYIIILILVIAIFGLIIFGIVKLILHLINKSEKKQMQKIKEAAKADNKNTQTAGKKDAVKKEEEYKLIDDKAKENSGKPE